MPSLVRAFWFVGSVCALLVVGCGSPPAVEDAGSDAAPSCTLDDDCDDGVFCNGAEQCEASGCVPGSAACMAGQTCSEDANACETMCDVSADADGDGVDSTDCGGMDCDDSDADRFPGNVEICDTGDRDEDCDPETFGDRDLDGDGHDDALCCNGTACGEDCDDLRRGVSPIASEVCDGFDNDCDGSIDEGLAIRLYRDEDYDGRGRANRTGEAPAMVCPGTPGYEATSDDCDDANPARHPGQLEICDAQDNDCDGTTDERTSAATWYLDEDADGFGRPDVSTTSCAPPAGYSLLNSDCDDGDRDVRPGQAEICDGLDNDCFGGANYVLGAGDSEDDDLDGAPDLGCPRVGSDCNDDDPRSFAGAPEICDARDNDCDGTVDDSTVDVDWYADDDGDTFGDAAATATRSCEPIAGASTRGGDCDDADERVYPHAGETCDGFDEDCDGEIDEGNARAAYYPDVDLDTWGDSTGTPVLSCTVRAGLVNHPGDCDDTDAARQPEAAETCDEVDEDCDGEIDEDFSISQCWPDGDSDGYALSGATASRVCTASCGAGATSVDPSVLGSADCDDADASRSPGDSEVCDGIDQDCDGEIDDGTAMTLCWGDADRDGYASATATPTPTCAVVCPLSATDRDPTAVGQADCDDARAAARPGAGETCNGLDDDCDGVADDGLSAISCWLDVDGDGWPRMGTAPTTTCSGACAAGTTANNPVGGTDCNDANATLGAPRTFYRDFDGDTFGDAFTTTTACTAPSGYVSNSTDCEDTMAAVRPGAVEVCNGTNDDCDAATDESPATSTCSLANTSAYACIAGSCEVAMCAPNHGDCDMVASNGCETDHRTDEAACGDCFTTCAAGEQCANGSCASLASFALGDEFGCAVRTDGRVRCWGRGGTGQIGDGFIVNRASAQPVRTGPGVELTDIVEVSAGHSHACARTATGELWCWGNNSDHQTGSTAAGPITYATQVAGVTDVVDVAAGDYHTCIIVDADRNGLGDWRCFGQNDAGQLGNGSAGSTDYAVPQAVQDVGTMAAITDATIIASGTDFGCAVRGSAGTAVSCVGWQYGGRLGNGVTTSSSATRAVPVMGLPGVRVLGLGGVNVTGMIGAPLAPGFSAVSWGFQPNGQSGTGISGSVAVATPIVPDTLEVQQMTSSTNQACLRYRSGATSRARCAGFGSSGALGVGAPSGGTLTFAADVVVNGGAPLEGVRQIEVGTNFTCALTDASVVMCFGQCDVGECGDGVASNHSRAFADPALPVLGLL